MASEESEFDEQSDWAPLLGNLQRRTAEARAMGGPEKLARQREGGRMDARQRVDALLDTGSFRELGTLVGSHARGDLPAVAADALVCGIGRVDGRPLLVGSEDFSSKGGSIGLGTHAKRVRLARLAAQERVPLVMMLEGAGERVTNAIERHGYAPNDLQALAELSGLVPTVCLVMGPSAGHGALTAPLMDFVAIVDGAAIFSAGPPLVAASIGEQLSKEELGGARMHAAESGVVHNAVATEQEAIGLARRYLGYFPSNAWEPPPRREPSGDDERRIDEILELAGAFHLPVVFLADNPGVMAGSAAERDGALRAGARLFSAQAHLRVPKLHVTIRKAFGFGSSIMAMNPFDRQTLTLALPTATLGAMPAGGGGSAAGADPQLQERLDQLESEGPWGTADTMGFDEVIDPRELRNALLSGLELASRRRTRRLAPTVTRGIRP